MKTKLHYLAILNIFFSLSTLTYGQTTYVNDFEPGSDSFITKYGATYVNVTNPSPTGNSTANCARIGSTSGNWYELIEFVGNFTVPANTTKYIHVRVLCTVVPDFRANVDATAGNDGTDFIDPMTAYTGSGLWEDLVFQVDGGSGGITPLKLIFLTDVGNQLGDTDSISLYLDEIIVSDSSSPILGVNDLEKNNTFRAYPNPTKDFWTFATKNNSSISSIQIIDLMGKTVLTKSNPSNKANVDASNLTKGIYFAKITSTDNIVQTVKLIKN
ncbi:T9SS type A sorting domain-containing protein [Flavivirga sp. 57AJ16]|uniref:T9SS type A sorting domain-containing protein n=1 Tax=Flavivirga sp. 57AJ16 TaxID=3025307 RepID=UPI002366C042|nr:T9SS type A sorting domain-containing protein [Flavivirga sp. 57AJ16]MDD7885379.1 T9SS type A sorting domain-containing protein [Flavivirga sp. 57AJ16]